MDYTNKFSDVNPDIFAKRVNRHITNLIKPVYPQVGESFSESIGGGMRLSGVSAPALTQILTLFFPPELSLDRPERRENDDFYFEIVPLTAQRLEFNAKCKTPALKKIFTELVAKIEADFQPAKPATLKKTGGNHEWTEDETRSKLRKIGVKGRIRQDRIIKLTGDIMAGKKERSDIDLSDKSLYDKDKNLAKRAGLLPPDF